MNWQLFFSTFLLVFLAEMGDKTQLTVLCQTAGNSSKWVVFTAGSIALVLATAIGVFAGTFLKRYIPDLRTIRIVSGTLFLIFGCLILVEAFRTESRVRKVKPGSVVDRQERNVAEAVQKGAATVSQAETTDASVLWNRNTVILQTSLFERASLLDYLALAEGAKEEREKRTYTQLVKEEQWHHEAMLCALSGGKDHDFPFTGQMIQNLPDPRTMIRQAAHSENPVEQAISNELAMARYYRVLAGGTENVRLRDTFVGLSVAEEKHAKWLEELKRK
ncbi:MAG: TMEM165/GDT1 family protein [Kiritimatiellae bacterium]|nr:TMEM165/GDT1 family protein [Kiritimatiellia bacterium]